MKRYLFFVIIGIFFLDVKAQDIDLLWKARAIRTEERLDSLSKIKDPSDKIISEMRLEYAYRVIISIPNILSLFFIASAYKLRSLFSHVCSLL